MIYAKALGTTLRTLLDTDDRVILLGEDIADPYGGAFKVTRGLSSDFPGRVRTTPISEGAIAGIAAGLALSGFRPITEIMFGDFLTLCFDQIVNHIAKYGAMYNGQASCPVIIRTPSGGGRGYGPTHSQSLEKYFCGIPHLKVLAASLYHDPLEMYHSLLSHHGPAIFVEHKLLYPLHMSPPEDNTIGEELAWSYRSEDQLPTIAISAVPREDCSVTILAYGYQAYVAAKIIRRLAIEEEIFAELLVPAQLSPFDYSPVEKSVNQTCCLITIEEGTAGWSWGTEISSEISKRCFGKLRQPVQVLASAATIIPSAKQLESEMLIKDTKVEAVIRELAE